MPLGRVARGQRPIGRQRLLYLKTRAARFLLTSKHTNVAERNPERNSAPSVSPVKLVIRADRRERDDKKLWFFLNANQFPDIARHGCFYGWPGGWSELQQKGYFGEFNLLLAVAVVIQRVSRNPRGLSLPICLTFTSTSASLHVFSFLLQPLCSFLFYYFNGKLWNPCLSFL